MNIPVVFAFDKNYLFPSGVCLYSLLVNSKKDIFYEVYIIQDDISKKDQEIFKNKFKLFKNQININFIDINFDLNVTVFHESWSKAAYYRLFMEDLLPKYDKVIYSDADIIFNNDIDDFYKIELDDFYIASAKTLFCNKEIKEGQYPNKYKGMEYNKVINSGFMLLNLKKMREDNIQGKFIKFISKENPPMQDLAAYNVICKDKIKYVSPKYLVCNYQNTKQAMNNKEIKRIAVELYSNKEINEMLNNYTVLHYSGSNKPWISYDAPLADIWLKYYKESPFRSEKIKYKISLKNKFKKLRKGLFRVKLNSKSKLIKLFGITLYEKKY